MRTKTLLCLAALTAGAFTAMAQSNVYSLNVVGYINVTVPANGFAMIANQLNTTNNTLGSLIATAPDGAQFFKYNGTYTTYTYDALAPGWQPDGNVTLNPGEGGFFKNNTAAALTITFVGEVMQGNLTNSLPDAGKYAIRSSMVPQAASLQDLGVPTEDGDQVYTYAAGYTTFTYDALTPGWTPGDVKGPTIGVGQAFFFKSATGATIKEWVRNFTVQ